MKLFQEVFDNSIKPSLEEIREIIKDRIHYEYLDKDDERAKNLDEDAHSIFILIKSWKFPMTVFRGLRLPAEKGLNLNNPGIHWTDHWELFDSDGVYGFNKPNLILSGLITIEMVNWKQTVIDRYSDLYDKGKEFEIELKRDAIPDNLTVETDMR